MINRHENPYD
jgi:hypothetical protein